MKTLKICIRLLCVSLLLIGCSNTNKEKTIKNNKNEYCDFTMYNLGSIPSAIMYDEKIYWETSEDNITYDIKSLKKIKTHTKKDCFPSNEGVVSYATKDLVGKSYFFTKDKVHVQMDNSTKYFTYIDTMELADAVVLEDNQKDDPVLSPDMYILHFIYKGMMYVTHDSAPLDALPPYFEKVGEVEEQFKRAKKDFTGNISVGDTLFATTFQNRFMIVQSKLDNNYYVYENFGYRELEENNN